MRRRTTASAALAAALFAAGAAGQPPAPPAKADPTDALIQKALANDPDVQVARAKLALAEAEVAKARQAAVGRVLALRGTIDAQRAECDAHLTALKSTERLVDMKVVTPGELAPYRAKLVAAQAALARSETELRLLTGDGPKAATPATGQASSDDIAAEIAELLYMTHPKVLARIARPDIKPLTGPVPDRLRATLGKKVSLGPKGAKVLLDDAVKAFKEQAGFDVAVRPVGLKLEVVTDGGELPVVSWLQMYEDSGWPGGASAFYVREYGLLIGDAKTAPPDAVSLTAFWRASAAEGVGPPNAMPATPKGPPAAFREFPHDKLPPALKAKVGEAIMVTLPVKRAGVEEAKTASSGPPVVVNLSAKGDLATVVIQAERRGKAQVTWDILTADGRRFTERGREVEFE